MAKRSRRQSQNGMLMRRILVHLREFDVDEVKLLCKRYRENEGVPTRAPVELPESTSSSASSRRTRPVSSGDTPTPPKEKGKAPTTAKSAKKKKRAPTKKSKKG